MRSIFFLKKPENIFRKEDDLSRLNLTAEMEIFEKSLTAKGESVEVFEKHKVCYSNFF